MTGNYSIAPICGYLTTTPQDLGKAQVVKGSYKPKSEYGNIPQVKMKISTENSSFTHTGYITPDGTTIMGVMGGKCFVPKNSDKIQKCITQLGDGTELVQDQSGVRIQQNMSQNPYTVKAKIEGVFPLKH